MPPPAPDARHAPELTVVIPAFNEEHRLGATLERVLGYLARRGLDAEVLVADDGSTDGTPAVAEGLAARGVGLLRDPQNRGKGAAVRRGVLASRGRRVLISDADLSTPIEELPRLEARLHQAPLVYGSRAVAGARVTRRQPLYREWMGKCFNRIIRLAGVGGIRDTQCGFKLLDGAVARELFRDLVTDGFAFDVELTWRARQRGHRIVEVGVEWVDSRPSRVRPLADSLAMLSEVLRFRLLYRARPSAKRQE
ncbi:MAG: glycosyltransferase family 2 protein [Thermoanaerobaculia bacterium]|nr:glycosyltransferase family 2 protein [Thermoanaerobaculia bacterium]